MTAIGVVAVTLLAGPVRAQRIGPGSGGVGKAAGDPGQHGGGSETERPSTSVLPKGFRKELYALARGYEEISERDECAREAEALHAIGERVRELLRRVASQPGFEAEGEDLQLVERARDRMREALSSCATRAGGKPPPKKSSIEKSGRAPHCDQCMGDPLMSLLQQKLVKPLDDMFRFRVTALDGVPAVFGRYAYLVTKAMPRPDDANDRNALAIKAVFRSSSKAPADIQSVPDLKRYGALLVPGDGTAVEDTWQGWAKGYGLGLANRVRKLVCTGHCDEPSRAGPFILVTAEPLRDDVVTKPAVFDLSAATPSMIDEFVRVLQELLREGRTWSGDDAPGLTLLSVRAKLAALGGTTLQMVGHVAELVPVAGKLVPATVAPARTRQEL